MFVCCECCVLSGRGLCDGLITRPEESYRLWCVVVCDPETSWMTRPWPTGGCRTKNKKRTNKQTNKIPPTFMLMERGTKYVITTWPSSCEFQTARLYSTNIVSTCIYLFFFNWGYSPCARAALLWIIMHRAVVVSNRRFGTVRLSQKKSVRIHHHSLRNDPEERSSHSLGGGSLKSPTCKSHIFYTLNNLI